MPKLFSTKDIVKVLENFGFEYTDQTGSHIKYRRIWKPFLVVIVPANKRQIPTGTFRSILRQAKMTLEDFEKEFERL